MSYNQWVEMFIEPINFDLTLKNVTLNWGKFFKAGDPNIEIPISEIEGKIIKPKDKFCLASCGREGAASGTEGGFSLCDGKDIIAKYYWCDPWGAGGSTSTLTLSQHMDYFFRFEAVYDGPTPLGYVPMMILKYNPFSK